MTPDQTSIDSFDSGTNEGRQKSVSNDEESKKFEEDTNKINLTGLKEVNNTPLAFFAALGTLRLLSKQYNGRVKLRWKKESPTYIPQLKVEGGETLTQEDIIGTIKTGLYDSCSGTKLLYEETAGKLWDEDDDKDPLLNGGGNSSIVIEESDDNDDSEVNVNRLLESQDEELIQVLSGFCAAVPGDNDNEERGVSITDLKLGAAGQKTLSSSIPRYTKEKSLRERLSEVNGVTDEKIDALFDKFNINTEEDIRNLTVEEIADADISRLGKGTAKKIKEKFEFRSGKLYQALFKKWEYNDRWKGNADIPTVLRLDPYETSTGQTVIGANILAAEAFPFFTVIPKEETETVCAIKERSGEVVGRFRYPLWEDWLTVDGVNYILSHPELRSEDPDTDDLRHIEIIYEVEEVKSGDYSNFKPPKIV